MRKKNDDCSNLDIEDLAKQAFSDLKSSEMEKLRTDNFNLGSKIVSLREELEEKINEIEHLKNLLNGVTPIIGEASPFILSDIEIIKTQQIKKLKDASMHRELTLDEVKRLDLLVKNQNLARGEATEIPGKTKLKDKSPNELVRIAKSQLKGIE